MEAPEEELEEFYAAAAVGLEDTEPENGELTEEEEGEVRLQMSLLNSRWEDLRLKAMERQSRFVSWPITVSLSILYKYAKILKLIQSSTIT